jgi:hypothetical protein
MNAWRKVSAFTSLSFFIHLMVTTTLSLPSSATQRAWDGSHHKGGGSDDDDGDDGGGGGW